MHRLQDDLAREIGATNSTRERVLERAKEAQSDRGILLEQEESLSEQREEAKEILQLAKNEWEHARSEEAALAVDVAHLEGDVARLNERHEQLVRRVTRLKIVFLL
ncbi:MAG: hypothetical protein Ct9H300mP15_09790 [Gemmatimonadota bacterium]|nr:MAG: hypothetical protein Ct9H300mP15_09790 [Gemmatimonadota bacterium]